MVAPIGQASIQNYQYQPFNRGPSEPTSPAQAPSIPATAAAEKDAPIGPKQCATCAARKYKDQSDDSSVSFQTSTSVPPQLAASEVRFHEQEHVQHNAVKADAAGLKATSSVQIHTAVCPECGRIYVSGGTTITSYSQKQPASFSSSETSGTLVNIRV
jgi:hypothetical protein